MTVWILAAFGVVFVVYAIVNAIRYGGSGSWPEAEGTVEITEVRPFDERSYCGVIRYSYSAGGETYSGEYSTPSMGKRENAAALIAAHFPGGKKLVVRYDPRRRDRSVLDVDPAIYERNPMIKLDTAGRP